MDKDCPFYEICRDMTVEELVSSCGCHKKKNTVKLHDRDGNVIASVTIPPNPDGRELLAYKGRTFKNINGRFIEVDVIQLIKTKDED